MAIQFINSTLNNSNNSTTLTVTKPTNTAQGDLVMVYVIYWGSSVTASMTAAGFATLDNDIPGNLSSSHVFYSFWKIAGSSEGASWTCTFSSSSTWAVCVAYTLRNVTATPISHHSTKADASAYTNTLPQATSTKTNSTDGTIYTYGGINSGASGTVSITSWPASLLNTAQSNDSQLGGVVGVGWGINLSSPGSATSNDAAGLDYLDSFQDILASVSFAGEDEASFLSYPVLAW